MIDLLLQRDKGRMRMQRFLHGGAFHRPGTVLDRLRNGLRAIDMDAMMRGVIHPSLHGEQPHRIRPQHDVIDPV